MRGALVESVHDIMACATDATGAVVLAHGDIDAPVYLRSAIKPFIAAYVVASGAAERFALNTREIALIAASHNGEPEHVATAAAILRKIGLNASALQCGAHVPSYPPAAAALAATGDVPTALHNNCSGKHAGILAACLHRGWDPAGYLAVDHPVQAAILAFCARLTGDDPATLPLGIDGCGIPIFATSLRRAAGAFARFAASGDAAPEGVAPDDARGLGIVRAAMIAEPFYVGGSGRFDSALSTATQGRILGKAGAEGVHGDALVALRLGLALKIVDGARRAVAPATMALLRELGALDRDAQTALASFGAPEVTNVAGRVVGAIRAGVADTIHHPVAS